jgi:leucyl aminopeptidase
MEFVSATSLEKRSKADLLVIPFIKGSNGPEALGDVADLASDWKMIIEAQDFKAKEGEVFVLFVEGKPEKRLVLLGLGSSEKITTEILRRAYSALAKFCVVKNFQTINLLLPALSFIPEDLVIRGVSEGLLLSNYIFNKHKHHTLHEPKRTLIEKVVLIGADKQALALAKKCKTICQGVYLARDLVNSNAELVDSPYLVEKAHELAKEFPKLKVKVLDKKKIEAEKMGLLLAVNKGSTIPPAFIMIEYKGNPKSKDHTVLIGKGITYDTGGLHLKTANMENMRCDMGGAACVYGTLSAIAALGLKVNVTGVVPTTDNCISATSYKPGDVYDSYSGKTVEILNTDAEGRLVLADALSYTQKHLHPTRMIDVATLTGAMEIILSVEATGLFSNNDALADLLARAGSETFERVWRLPLYEEYKEKLKSDVADIKNWNGRGAGSIIAAMFLQQFVGDVPWAHLDIASTAFLGEEKRYNPKYATGVGVRLLIEFLENI